MEEKDIPNDLVDIHLQIGVNQDSDSQQLSHQDQANEMYLQEKNKER